MIVVFDTNAYRGIVRGVAFDKVTLLAEQMIMAEKAKGITAMMCTITAEELLSHLLDDESSLSYNSCLKASVFCYHHCEENAQCFRLLPNPETQIAREYFGHDNQKSINTQNAVGQILSLIHGNPNHETIEKHTDILLKIKEHVAGAEQELINQVRKYGKQIDPLFNDWGFFVNDSKKRLEYLRFIRSNEFEVQSASAFLCAVALELESQGVQLSLTKEEINNQIQTYLKSYPAVVSFRRFFFEQLVNPGFDLSTDSRANYLWDEQILYFVGHKCAREKVLLVTSDKKMIKAANNTGYNSYVMSLDDYRVLLGL